jgi:hypothetical protein
MVAPRAQRRHGQKSRCSAAVPRASVVQDTVRSSSGRTACKEKRCEYQIGTTCCVIVIAVHTKSLSNQFRRTSSAEDTARQGLEETLFGQKEEREKNKDKEQSKVQPAVRIEEGDTWEEADKETLVP